MYKYGARFTGTDISENQIEQAKRLAARDGMDIDFLCYPPEKLDFAGNTFDAGAVNGRETWVALLGLGAL